MKWTKLSELGTGGRLLVSVLVGFAISFSVMALGLIGITQFRSSIASPVLLLPMLPGLAVAALFGLYGNDFAAFIAPMWLNAAIYGLVVFQWWQRQVKGARRMETPSTEPAIIEKADC